ncbi:tegument protein UL14 [Aotine betaherpesvirus 1]|uniref:Tegument protein UL14 n=1 Tax=Aotine betaherpesvirus 1 TaxID=50290 RepID=G8XUG1_9BETA|nr:tegument protein UL14 [Aotine betaherpesvirus 1]AEV80791.1 tegument protein UL14 [Aotine betaherpesvirus 1]
MTSTDKELLKEAMKAELEKRQHQFLRRSYGEQHHLTHHQALKVMSAAAGAEHRRGALVVREISNSLLRQRQRLQQDLARARELQNSQVDAALDCLTEFKDAVDDSYSAFVDSVSSTCSVDLEEPTGVGRGAR